MKPLAFLLLITGFLTGSLLAHQDYWAGRVWVQYIAISHERLSEILSAEKTEDITLHQQLIQLSKAGKAMVLDTTMVSCTRGMRATVESHTEDIYPSEYDPPGLGYGGVTEINENKEDFTSESSYDPKLRAFAAFETRNVGICLEIEPMFRENTTRVRFVSEMIRRDHYESWINYDDAWGKIRAEFPVYETWRTNTILTLKNGNFCLASVITPKWQPPAPFLKQRILVFVRADATAYDPN